MTSSTFTVLLTFSPLNHQAGHNRSLFSLCWKRFLLVCSSLSSTGVGFILVIDRRQDRWAAVKGTLLRIAVSLSLPLQIWACTCLLHESHWDRNRYFIAFCMFFSCCMIHQDRGNFWYNLFHCSLILLLFRWKTDTNRIRRMLFWSMFHLSQALLVYSEPECLYDRPCFRLSVGSWWSTGSAP